MMRLFGSLLVKEEMVERSRVCVLVVVVLLLVVIVQ